VAIDSHPGWAVVFYCACSMEFHAGREKDAAKLLGIPFETVMQTALIPVAYTKGVKFKLGPRKSLETVLHWDDW